MTNPYNVAQKLIRVEVFTLQLFWYLVECYIYKSVS